MTDKPHCDEYIDDTSAPTAPVLWATVKPDSLAPLAHFLGSKGIALGQRVRVCMASRFGDVGINTTGADHGYAARVGVEDLTDFSATREFTP